MSQLWSVKYTFKADSASVVIVKLNYFFSNPKTSPPGVPLKLLIGLPGFEVETEEHRCVPFFVFD